MVSASKNTVEPPASTSVIYIRTHRHEQSVIFAHCLKFLYHGNGTCSSQNFVDASTSVQVGSLTFCMHTLVLVYLTTSLEWFPELLWPALLRSAIGSSWSRVLVADHVHLFWVPIGSLSCLRLLSVIGRENWARLISIFKCPVWTY